MSNEIFIRVDKPEYTEGDTIYGTVYLRVVKPFQASSLFLDIKGYEKVFWEYHDTEYETDSQGNRVAKTVVKDREAEKDFFKDHFKIISYPGGFPIGDWSYPFQYRLPNELPGVFEKKKMKHGLKFKGKICYKLKATVDVINGGDLKYKTHLVINERLDKLIQPHHTTKEITVRTCCCIPRGNVSCEAWMDKNCYMSGETAQLHVKVDNKSAVKVNHFNSKLIRYITFEDSKGHKKQIKDVVSMKKYDGTDAHSMKDSDIPLLLFGKKEKLLKPSCKSKLIHCRYEVMIELDIPWAPDLEIYTPVIIYAPQSLMWMNWQPPQWITQAQYQPVEGQLAVPQEILDTRMQGGYFQPPPNFQVIPVPTYHA